MTMSQPPGGQGPIDPRGAFSPPPPPGPGGPGRQPAPPAPYPPPPMLMPPLPPPMGYHLTPNKGGFVRAIFVTLATTVFGLSLILNVYLLLWAGLTGSDSAARTDVLESGDASQKVAVVRIEGGLSSQSAGQFVNLLKRVEADNKVKALVLEIDSPGGGVTASDEIYNAVKQFKARKGIPIVTAMGGLCASGGYYVACASDEIIAQPTTITGSIGVILQRFNYSGTMQKIGIEETSIVPNGAEFKNLGSPFKPESPQVNAYLRPIADEIFTRFKTIVETARGSRLKEPIANLASGKVYTANDALKFGLIDAVGYSKDAYDRAAALAGLTDKMVVRFERQPSLFEAVGLGIESVSGREINLRLDTSMLDDFLTPRVMYLWRGD